MSDNIYVGIAECKTGKAPDVLVCSALGSCVAVCLYDRTTLLAGVVHLLLPVTPEINRGGSPAKYADQGVSYLLSEMKKLGAKHSSLYAKIAGGASIYKFQQNSEIGNIGSRNVKVAKDELMRLGIPIMAEDTGKDYGRSVRFYPDSGKMTVKSPRNGEKTF
ncbi:MAG: chemotaxis protein CheD [Synergistaceae bacterium]